MVKPSNRPHHRLAGALATAALIGVVSCSGDGGVGPSSGLSRQATVASLTPQQAGTLCDWTNARQGGYGRDVTCSNGSSEGTDPDKQSCVESIPYIGTACPTLTVADIEDCANAIGSDVCMIATAAGCANLRQCLASVGS
jgi:hypothetical protein